MIKAQGHDSLGDVYKTLKVQSRSLYFANSYFHNHF